MLKNQVQHHLQQHIRLNIPLTHIHTLLILIQCQNIMINQDILELNIDTDINIDIDIELFL